MQRPALDPATKSVERLCILGLILLGWALIVVLRLFDLQVLAHERYVKLADSQQDKLIAVDAPRGAIFDREGHPLALSSPSQFAVVNPSRIGNKEMAAALLARILGLDAKKLQADLEAAAA